jgi:hypothetical protein
MKIRNKTNLVLLVFLALILTVACNLDEETATNNTNKDTVATTDNKDTDTQDVDEITDETDQSDEESDESENNSGPITVKFSKGKISRSYNKPIKRGESHTYYLSASAGQKMSVEIRSSQENAGFTVYDPAGEEISAAEETTEVREFNEDLESSGRYKFVVRTGQDTNYDISFKVSAKSNDLTPDEAAGGANKTVKFGKGKSSASYSNSVIRGDQDTYNLKAGAGQFMTVTVTSAENNASFQIIAPNGKELVLDDTNWIEELPATGNYKIIVGAGRGNATYTIKFLVEQSPIDH